MICVINDVQAFAHFYAEHRRAHLKLQRDLTQYSERLERDAIKHDLHAQENQDGLKRLHCTSRRGASSWLTVLPHHQRTTIPDADFTAGVKLRLGVTWTVNFSCGCHPVERARATHPLSCALRRGHLNIYRHNAIRDELYHWATAAGITAIREPTGLAADANLRPDLLLLMDGQQLLVDVTVVNPSAKSHDPETVPTTIRQAEREKLNKYRQLALDHGATIVPFVVDVYGGLNKHARELLSRIASTAAEHEVESFASYRQSVAGAVSAALVRGNGALVRTWLNQRRPMQRVLRVTIGDD